MKLTEEAILAGARASDPDAWRAIEDGREQLPGSMWHVRRQIAIDRARTCLTAALSQLSPAEGWQQGDLVYCDTDTVKLKGQVVGTVEGWIELAFADGSTAIVRPSRVTPRAHEVPS